MLTLAGTAVLLHNLAVSGGMPLRKPLSELPMQVGQWSGRTEFFEPGVVAALGVDDYVLRTYRDPSGRGLGLYVGYYGSQRLSERVHSPQVCLPGAGWVIVDHRLLALPVEDQTVTVNRVVIEKGGSRQLVLYWYQVGRRVVAREREALLLLAWNALARRRSDEVLVRVNGPLGPSARDAEGLQGAFVRLLWPVLATHVAP